MDQDKDEVGLRAVDVVEGSIAESSQLRDIEALRVLPCDTLDKLGAEAFYVYAVVYSPELAGGGCFRGGRGEEITFKDVLVTASEIEVRRFSSNGEPRLCERQRDEARSAWANFKIMDLVPGDIIRTRFGTKRTIKKVLFDPTKYGGRLTIERKPHTGETSLEEILMSKLLTPAFVGQIERIHRPRSGRARILEGISVY